jgi:hypothetical protein
LFDRITEWAIPIRCSGRWSSLVTSQSLISPFLDSWTMQAAAKPLRTARQAMQRRAADGL